MEEMEEVMKRKEKGKMEGSKRETFPLVYEKIGEAMEEGKERKERIEEGWKVNVRRGMEMEEGKKEGTGVIKSKIREGSGS